MQVWRAILDKQLKLGRSRSERSSPSDQQTSGYLLTNPKPFAVTKMMNIYLQTMLKLPFTIAVSWRRPSSMNSLSPRTLRKP